jgi:hypothetical protein
MDLSVPGRKSLLRDVLSLRLPEPERAEFRAWAEDVCTEDFIKCLPTYFSVEEMNTALAEYVSERFQELEFFCDARIDAVITIGPNRYEYRCYNEAMQT